MKSLSEGEIAGKNVTRLKPGDEVFGSGSGTFGKFARAPGALPAPLQTLDRRLASSPRHRARIELLA